MRKTVKRAPVEHDVRKIKKFLLFPRTIKTELRWLEVAYIEQEYIEVEQDFCRGLEWVDKSWSY